MAALVYAAATGVWRMKQIYLYGYSPLCAFILLLGMMGKLPRVGTSTQGEGWERRYFYGSVWAVTAAQTILLVLWKTLPEDSTGSLIKLVVFVAVLVVFGSAAARGILPRTRPIVPGELMVSD
jgi:peptidoglycan/LPS O-acetylase OafA/YrhL